MTSSQYQEKLLTVTKQIQQSPRPNVDSDDSCEIRGSPQIAEVDDEVHSGAFMVENQKLGSFWKADQDSLDHANSLRMSLEGMNGGKIFSPEKDFTHVLNSVNRDLTDENFAHALTEVEGLQKINVSQNELTELTITQFQNHFASLQVLRADRNKINLIEQKMFWNTPILQELSLRGNKLSTVPDSLFKCQYLRILDISNNQMVSLSTRVSQLTALKELKIQNNLMTELPNSICTLKHLETFSCEWLMYLDTQNIRDPEAHGVIARYSITKVNEFDIFSKVQDVFSGAFYTTTVRFLDFLTLFHYGTMASDSDSLIKLIMSPKLGTEGTLLHCICHNNHSHLLQSLKSTSLLETDLAIPFSLAVNATNRLDQSPLAVAVDCRNTSLAQDYLEQFAEKIELQTVAKDSHPLVLAIVNHKLELAYKILTAMFKCYKKRRRNRTKGDEPEKYDLNKTDGEECDQLTFLHHLFANFSSDDDNSIKLFRLMLMQTSERTHGTYVQELHLNALSSFGETPLDLAVEHNQLSAVEYITAFNKASVEACRYTQIFDVNSSDNPRQYTSLHRAVIAHNYQAAMTLLQTVQDKREEPKVKYDDKMKSIDVYKRDHLMRKARDFVVKMVFLSKLIQRAETKQIWNHMLSAKVSKKSLVTEPKQPVHTCLSRYFMTEQQVDKSKFSTFHNKSMNSIEIDRHQIKNEKVHRQVKLAKSMAFNSMSKRMNKIESKPIPDKQKQEPIGVVPEPNEHHDYFFQTVRVSAKNQLPAQKKELLHYSSKLTIKKEKIKKQQKLPSPIQLESGIPAPTGLPEPRSSPYLFGRRSPQQSLFQNKRPIAGSDRIGLQRSPSGVKRVASDKDLVEQPEISDNEYYQGNTKLRETKLTKMRAKQLSTKEAQQPKHTDDVPHMAESIMDDSLEFGLELQLKDLTTEFNEDNNRKSSARRSLQGKSPDDKLSNCEFDLDDDENHLPMSQSGYTMQIKSFCYYRRPYYAQIQSNQFERTFFKLMDTDEQPPIQTDKSKPAPTSKPVVKAKLTHYQKVNELYQILQIVGEKPQALQDALDIFDYLMYEIDQKPENKVPESSGIMFMKDEIRTLRSQLQMMAKRMVTVPTRADFAKSFKVFSFIPTPNIKDSQIVSDEEPDLPINSDYTATPVTRSKEKSSIKEPVVKVTPTLALLLSDRRENLVQSERDGQEGIRKKPQIQQIQKTPNKIRQSSVKPQQKKLVEQDSAELSQVNSAGQQSPVIKVLPAKQTKYSSPRERVGASAPPADATASTPRASAATVKIELGCSPTRKSPAKIRSFETGFTRTTKAKKLVSSYKDLMYIAGETAPKVEPTLKKSILDKFRQPHDHNIQSQKVFSLSKRVAQVGGEMPDKLGADEAVARPARVQTMKSSLITKKMSFNSKKQQYAPQTNIYSQKVLPWTTPASKNKMTLSQPTSQKKMPASNHKMVATASPVKVTKIKTTMIDTGSGLNSKGNSKRNTLSLNYFVMGSGASSKKPVSTATTLKKAPFTHAQKTSVQKPRISSTRSKQTSTKQSISIQTNRENYKSKDVLKELLYTKVPSKQTTSTTSRTLAKSTQSVPRLQAEHKFQASQSLIKGNMDRSHLSAKSFDDKTAYQKTNSLIQRLLARKVQQKPQNKTSVIQLNL